MWEVSVILQDGYRLVAARTSSFQSVCWHANRLWQGRDRRRNAKPHIRWAPL
jgi:hypothetical protein